MPRVKLSTSGTLFARGKSPLADELAAELKSQRESGQPVIHETEFPNSDQLRVVVIWDAWHNLTHEARTDTIHQAYELAEGAAARNRIGLASGLTVPEAFGAGMLPVQVIAALRKSDPVTAEQCNAALIEEGASVLVSPEKPQLRFATLDEADAACQRLAKRLPGSDEVWVTLEEVGRVEADY